MVPLAIVALGGLFSSTVLYFLVDSCWISSFFLDGRSKKEEPDSELNLLEGLT